MEELNYPIHYAPIGRREKPRCVICEMLASYLFAGRIWHEWPARITWLDRNEGGVE
jgi:hypothetical protein